MADLGLRYEACVRTRSRAARCRACVDACPTGAVSIGGPRDAVSVDLGKCIECGVCQATCPAEAFRAPFDVAAFVTAGHGAIACGEAGLPCVAALAAEDLITLAHAQSELRIAPRIDCASAKSHWLIESRTEQANAFLLASGASAMVRLEVSFAGSRSKVAASVTPPSHDRRQFLRLFMPRAAAVAPAAKIEMEPTRLDVKALRTTAVPARRSRLLAVLGTQPEADAVASAEIEFASSKALDTETCTACMLCVNVCPTGALTTSELRNALHFDASRCVKCGACHDTCEPRALGLARTFDVAHFLARESRLLGRFAVQACGECGSLFKSDRGAVVCPRCDDLNAEARELLGHR